MPSLLTQNSPGRVTLISAFVALGTLSLIASASNDAVANEREFGKETRLLCRGFIEHRSHGLPRDVHTQKNIAFSASFRGRPSANAKSPGNKGREEIRLAVDGPILIIWTVGSYTSCSGYGDIIDCAQEQRFSTRGDDPASKGTPIEGRDVQTEEDQELKLDRRTGLMTYSYRLKGIYPNPTQLIRHDYSGTFECELANTRRF